MLVADSVKYQFMCWVDQQRSTRLSSFQRRIVVIGALLKISGPLFAVWQEFRNSTDWDDWEQGFESEDDYFIEPQPVEMFESGIELPIFLGIGCCLAFLFLVVVVVIVIFALRSKKTPAPSTNQESAPKTTYCGDCGGIVSKRAENCPHCGAPITQTDPTAEEPNG